MRGLWLAFTFQGCIMPNPFVRVELHTDDVAKAVLYAAATGIFAPAKSLDNAARANEQCNPVAEFST
jgi:hypothetical protein